MGQMDDAVSEVDLDRQQAAAVDHGWGLARRAVDHRDRAHGARSVQELAQPDDHGVERADGRDQLDAVFVHGALSPAAPPA